MDVGDHQVGQQFINERNGLITIISEEGFYSTWNEFAYIARVEKNRHIVVVSDSSLAKRYRPLYDEKVSYNRMNNIIEI